MEAEDWVMPSVTRPLSQMPEPLELHYEGAAEDASGKRHPLYALGGDPLPLPSFDEDENPRQ